ncbi:pilus assembly protein FimT [Pseudomonas sp. HMWF032]|nr:pilus assembly protein FimT [Pseudomonas sp. HMWF032]PTT84872.1 pilus assembly protein FimT [Pseudomonas sp. HMWF010]
MRGFTLIELMIILVLLSIVAGIAIPNLTRLITNHQIENQAQTLNSLLQFARTEAVVRRTSVAVVNNGNAWAVRLGGQTLIQETFDPERASVSTLPNPANITFNSNGSANPATTFVVCHEDNPIFAYRLILTASGHSRLYPRGKAEDGTDLGDCNP